MAHTTDPVNLNLIGKVVLEYQAFKVLKSLKSMKCTNQNNITTLNLYMKYAINSTNRLYVLEPYM